MSGKVSPTDTNLLGFQSSLELLKKKKKCVCAGMHAWSQRTVGSCSTVPPDPFETGSLTDVGPGPMASKL